MASDRKICVGMIAGAHGVKGLVRLRSFTSEPADVMEYGPLTSEDGEREFALQLKSATNDYFIASLAGVADREAAEALRGTKLFVSRAALPKLKKREFYEADLVGLVAADKDGKEIGKVLAVHNYGGGPFLEIAPGQGGSFMLPFTKECVPEVDVEEGRVVIDPPEGWIEANKKVKKERRNKPE
jgi:16S rRNA processing protein RimM